MPKDGGPNGGIGASTTRREDVRFLSGTGNYTDDINLHGQAHVHFLRSDVAHGKINGIDTSGAEAMPGEDPMTIPSPDDVAAELVKLVSKDETRTGQLINYRKVAAAH